ncbi:LysR family transcriptional regulator [Rhodococcus sp. 05-2255-3B1]|uniref:hydrogen peroxide-inducible genes activator n=1 Tax=unclassified Rhodococcus (in: high G+C Gram-positive bacteria) TaxID=192944 RepID=UPI000B9C1DDB|nr:MULTISPECIES: hydrogen peroxide-inducible genes activator [unclassified Rhodococcus (in: high G+C Gram-positive bacteria)]OZE05975.1 LysR family transcriptional regulator [Rhodococcus sp. 05-2255-3B1]OZE09184.1 LysR family transcriptional regulator [Rhodococcus sp. 05-2255-3C]OZE18128.1 LysR family transcriptional regulator [Rhodococcus sp. 05-2255-2A2]
MTDRSYQPTLSHLRAFAAIARHRHFGSAAAQLSITQPSLSQALAALEQGLGVQLIERSTRRVLLTPAGGQLLARATAALDAVDGFVATAAGLGGHLTGGIRLGIIPTVAPYVLPAVLPAVRAEYPDLVPRIVEDYTARLLDALRSGDLDVAVLALPLADPGLIEISMYTEDFVLALPAEHPLAGRRDLDVADLRGLPLLLLDEGHCLREQTLDLCRSVDIEPDASATRAASLTTVVQCVAGGLGLTLLPRSAVEVEVEVARAGLSTAEFAHPAPGRTIGLVHRSTSARSAEYRALASLLATEVRAGQADGLSRA